MILVLSSWDFDDRRQKAGQSQLNTDCKGRHGKNEDP